MNATEIVLPRIGEPESLEIRTREVGRPGPEQALVRVEATGVSFAEQQMRRGKYYDQPPFPFVPGYDLVGVVVQAGAGSPPEGQRVAALTKTGGWASHVVLCSDCFPKRRRERRRGTAWPALTHVDLRCLGPHRSRQR